MLAPAELATWKGIVGLATNDFDDVVFARFTIIRQLADAFRAHDAELAMLSGSGSAVYGVFSNAPTGAAIAPATGTQVIATRTAERVVRVEPDR